MRRWAVAAALALGGGLAGAAPTATAVRAEIDTLLARLAASGCQFNRNGSWYTGAEAKDHLLRKLAALEKRGNVGRTEQFIELAATGSSVSGKPYTVRCEGKAPVPSQQWLTQQLAALRQPAAGRPTP